MQYYIILLNCLQGEKIFFYPLFATTFFGEQNAADDFEKSAYHKRSWLLRLQVTLSPSGPDVKFIASVNRAFTRKAGFPAWLETNETDEMWKLFGGKKKKKLTDIRFYGLAFFRTWIGTKTYWTVGFLYNWIDDSSLVLDLLIHRINQLLQQN